MGQNSQSSLPLPDKKIPISVMLIGTYEIAVALLGLIILVLAGQFDGFTIAVFVLLVVYGALGAGLWAIQEWARFVNIVLHLLSLPYILYTALFWQGEVIWQPFVQLLISLSIIVALRRPAMRHKFQTVVSKKKKQAT